MTSEEVEEACSVVIIQRGILGKRNKVYSKEGPLFALYYDRTPVCKSGAIMIITRQRDAIGLEGKCYFF